MTAAASRVRLNITLYVAAVLFGCLALFGTAAIVGKVIADRDDSVNGTDVVPGVGLDVGRGKVEAVPLAGELEQRRTADQIEAATKMANAFINFSYKDAAGSIAAVKSMATGTFLKQYDKGAADLEKLATEAQSDMVAKVVWAGLVAGDEDTATVIVATSGTVTNKTTNFQPEARNYRIRLEMALEDGRWLTNDLQYVALG